MKTLLMKKLRLKTMCCPCWFPVKPHRSRCGFTLGTVQQLGYIAFNVVTGCLHPRTFPHIDSLAVAASGRFGTHIDGLEPGHGLAFGRAVVALVL